MEEIGDRREEIGDRREEIGDRREEIGDRGEEIGDRREEIGDRGEEIGDRREEIGDRGEEIGDRREEVVGPTADRPWRVRIAAGSSALRVATNSRRVAVGASAGRRRQTRTMLEARALDAVSRKRPDRSVRIGHVPVIPNPARITASRKVSHPVLAVPASISLSDCLNA
jgi:hypothetical protein